MTRFDEPSGTTVAGTDRATGDEDARRTALAYSRRMIERQYVALPPLGFDVDWADQPSRHKLYLDTPRRPLPPPSYRYQLPLLTSIGFAVGSQDLEPAETPTLPELADVLAVNGLVNRQTIVNWNDDAGARLQSATSSWSRPTASGGGMYPVETYVVSDGAGEIPRGVFHYDTAHHALDVVSTADRTGELRQATGRNAGCWLVGAARLWKNSFKYNSFCYHVVSQDAGALLGSWRVVLGAQQRAVVAALWFDQTLVSEVVEVDPELEVPMTVVPLGAPGRPTAGSDPTAPLDLHRDLPAVWERSRRTRRFPLVDEISTATWVTGRDSVPEPESAAVCAIAEPDGAVRPDTGRPPVVLPEPTGSGAGLSTALTERRSAFGLVGGPGGLPIDDLSEILAATAAIGLAPTDLAPAGREPWVRQWVIAKRVESLRPGCYRYDPVRHRLVWRDEADLDELQQRYALQNYSVSRSSALLVLSGRLRSIVEWYGAAGYRFLNIEVGQAVQAAYLASAGREVAIGAVLGVDNVTVNRWLGLESEDRGSLIDRPREQPDETSLLFCFLGTKPPAAARYDHRIPRGSSATTSTPDDERHSR